jgi:hypothetical protein
MAFSGVPFLNDVLSFFISETPSLQQALVAFKGKIINERKDAFKGMCGELDGLKVPLGVGGTHISVSNQSFYGYPKFRVI